MNIETEFGKLVGGTRFFVVYESKNNYDVRDKKDNHLVFSFSSKDAAMDWCKNHNGE